MDYPSETIEVVVRTAMITKLQLESAHADCVRSAMAIDLLAFVGCMDHGAGVILTQDTSNGPKSTASWSRLIGCERVY